MMEIQGLLSASDGNSFELAWRGLGEISPLRRNEVLVKVQASSINPIDVKRAAGYGSRVLRLKGAAGMPRVLGNDFAGTVQAVGTEVRDLQAGQRVWGVVDTGPRGAHATHVVVPAKQVLSAPNNRSDDTLAALPYTFCTVWQALRNANIHPDRMKGKRVLIHGASGGLGTLALQLLRHWEAFTTAVCSAPHIAHCLHAGASEAFDRTTHTLQELPPVYDHVLNFATWADEHWLAQRLHAQALGMSTTVHPLLGNLDRLGWVRGLLQTRRDHSTVASLVRQRSPHAAYRWTIFKPDSEALRVLQSLAEDGPLHLPIGISCPMNRAEPAFVHVASGRQGRAVLTHPL